MIGDLKPYPMMKVSGVEWLGEVPEHWELPRTKTILSERSEKGHPDKPMLAATQTKGVVRKEQYENRTVLALKDLHLLKLVCELDFVISLRSFQGGIEFAREEGIISPAYTVLYPNEPANHRFLAHLFKSRPYIENLGLFVTGIRQGQNIDYEKLSRSRLPLPPLSEQTAIVRYLDHVDRRVRRLVRAKRKLIALLTEQKQAIIHRAVTRGLDPDVPMKDSGVEWLGEVPSHWIVIALRRRWSVTDCKHLTVPFVEEDDAIPLASVREVQSFELSLSTAKRTTHENYASLIEGDRKPVAGDLIYCRNVSVGAAAVVMTNERFAMGQDVCLIRSAQENQRFLNYFLHSPAMERQLSLLLVGSTFNRINVADIKSLIIAVPPRSEQNEIASFLDNAQVEFDAAKKIAEKEIDLLTEYRTRLTADVVTGKLDVRAAAAALPEVDPLSADDELAPLDAESEVGLDDQGAITNEAEA